MSEQQAATESPRPHPESTGIYWGDSISMERQQELQGYLDRWEAESDHGERKGPFDTQRMEERPLTSQGVIKDRNTERLNLTGADVCWLAGLVAPSPYSTRTLSGPMPLSARHLHLEGAYLGWARLEGADLSGVHLEDAYLGSASLAQANLSFAHLQ